MREDCYRAVFVYCDASHRWAEVITDHSYNLKYFCDNENGGANHHLHLILWPSFPYGGRPIVIKIANDI